MQQFVVGKAHEDEPDLQQPQYAGVVPAVHFRWLLSGPSKSGKTNLARFSYDKFYTSNGGTKPWFDRVYLLSPTARIDFQWSGLAGLKDRDRITSPTPELLSRILNEQRRELTQGNESNSRANMQKIAQRRNRAKKVLIIFDDAIAESKLINSPEFLKVFIQGRHYNISSMVMTQSYMKVPRSARLQATHLSLFPSKQTEIDRVYREMCPKEMSKNDFYEMVGYAISPTPDSPFPFLYVDCFAPANERFRRNFNEKLEIDLKNDGSAMIEDDGMPEEKKDGGVKRGAEDIESKSKKRRKG